MREGSTQAAEVIRLRQSISSLLHRKVLEAVEFVLEEELSEALGIGRDERSEDRRGSLRAPYWLGPSRHPRCRMYRLWVGETTKCRLPSDPDPQGTRTYRALAERCRLLSDERFRGANWGRSGRSTEHPPAHLLDVWKARAETDQPGPSAPSRRCKSSLTAGVGADLMARSR